MWLRPAKTVLFDWMALKIFLFPSLFFTQFSSQKDVMAIYFGFFVTRLIYNSTAPAQIFIKYLLLLLVYQQCNDRL